MGKYQQLSQIIQIGQYDLVQANAGDTLKYAALSKKIFGFRSMLVFRNANKISGFLNGWIKKTINRFLMGEVDFVASVSQECMMDFQSVYPSFNNNIACLPIGVKPNTSVPYNGLKDIGIESNGPLLLHVAGFMPEKNHEGLIRIFHQVVSRFPGVKLLLVGEGRLQPRVLSLVQSLQLENNVVFLGRRKDVLKIMGCCQTLVLPSLIEGLPAVILEAFENKLPVVAYDTGGIREVVVPDKTGYLLTIGDEDGFADAVVNCLSSDNTALVDRAHQLIYERYSIQRVAADFEKCYSQLLSS